MKLLFRSVRCVPTSLLKALGHPVPQARYQVTRDICNAVAVFVCSCCAILLHVSPTVVLEPSNVVPACACLIRVGFGTSLVFRVHALLLLQDEETMNCEPWRLAYRKMRVEVSVIYNRSCERYLANAFTRRSKRPNTGRNLCFVVTS